MSLRSSVYDNRPARAVRPYHRHRDCGRVCGEHWSGLPPTHRGESRDPATPDGRTPFLLFLYLYTTAFHRASSWPSRRGISRRPRPATWSVVFDFSRGVPTSPNGVTAPSGNWELTQAMHVTAVSMARLPRSAGLAERRVAAPSGRQCRTRHVRHPAADPGAGHGTAPLVGDRLRDGRRSLRRSRRSRCRNRCHRTVRADPTAMSCGPAHAAVSAGRDATGLTATAVSRRNWCSPVCWVSAFAGTRPACPGRAAGVRGAHA